MRRRLVIAALVALTACEGASEADAPTCFSIQDCEEDRTCFFGRCVEAGFGLTTVYSELTPPNDSPWLEQQLPHPLDLEGFQELGLRASVPLSGAVRPGVAIDSLTGVMLVRATSQGVPGRDIVRQANVSTDGFELEVLPGLKALTFEPADDTKPPRDYWVDMGEVVRDQSFPYHTSAELAASTYHGVVLQADSLGSESWGARVVAFGSSPQHPDTVFRSTVATTNVDGEFEIILLPEASEFYVTVGPNPGVNDGVPEVTFGPYDAASGADLGNLSLGLEFDQPVTVGVIDESGTPVRDANVLFEGSVGEFGGRFVVSGSSNDFGNVVDATDGAPVKLWFGDYTVTVAPQKSQPYALVSEVATVPNGDLTVTVQHKVRLAGCVKEDDTVTPVANADLTITRLNSPIPRVFRTSTRADGCYDVLVDPGTVDADEVLTAAEYELTVQPGADTGLPFYRELMLVLEERILTHDIQLYEPELVYGMVRDPNGMPLANVIIAFYSLELGLPDEPVLVGIVSTLDGIRAGEFVLPVPIPRESE